MIEQKKTGRSGGPFRFNELWIYAIILAILGGLFLWDGGFGENKDMSWNEFRQMMNQGAFTQITVDRGEKTATAQLNKRAADSLFTHRSPVLGREQKRIEYTVKTQIPTVDRFAEAYDTSGTTAKVAYKEESSRWISLTANIVPFALIIIFWIYIFRRSSGGAGGGVGGGIFNISKSKAQLYEKESTSVTFNDVAGLHEAKVEIEEIVHFLKNPAKYTQLGGKIPKGALLVGPPGTGKTLLAKAVAGEAHVPFFSLAGSDFVEMFVGVGASRVRDLFKQAKEVAPSIVFIDEIDAVGRQRGAGLGGGHDEREQTLNQMLVEMDGFEDNSAVILIAATNRPDILDPALLRPGRFDRQVTVDRPDVKGRKKILGVHAENKPMEKTVDLGRIAKLTPGFTGADLANLMNESALLAARRRRERISMGEVEEAMERVMAGPEKKGRVMTQAERMTIAYHESGHALVGHVLENSDPVHKISIISRGRALGYTMQLPEEDRFLETRDGMLDQIAVLLGGRTAEELFCSDITTGASNDLERATKLAREMVTRYGMSDELEPRFMARPSTRSSWAATTPTTMTTRPRPPSASTTRSSA